MYNKQLWHRYRIQYKLKAHELKVIEGGIGLEQSRSSAEKRFADEVMEKIENCVPLEFIKGGLPNGELADSSEIIRTVKYYGPKKLPKIEAETTKSKSPEGRTSSISDFFRRK